MKNYILTTAISLSALFAKAQQTKLPLENFTGIELQGVQDVYLAQGTENTITIEGADGTNNNIKPNVSNNILRLDIDKKKPMPKNVKVTINFKSLESLEVSGALDVKGENEFTLTVFRVKSSGSSDVKLKCNANTITADIAGAGDVKLEGSAKEMQVNISGAGNLDANDFLCNKVNVDVSGAGDAKVNVIEELSGNCSGSGSVKFKGNPTNVRVTQTGAGSITPHDGKEVSMDFTIGGNNDDTTRIQIGKKKIIIIGKDKDGDDDKVESNEYPDPDKKIEKKIIIKKDEKKVKDIWQGIEVGVNGYLDPSGGTAMPASYGYLDLNYGKSIMINLNPIEKHYKIYKEYVAITTGLGLQFNRYAFIRSAQLQSNTDSVFAIDTKIDYTKNLLRMTYLTLPLMLEFNTSSNPAKSFHMAVGALLGYKLGKAKLVQKYEIANVSIQNLFKQSFNVNDFQYGLTARIGYGKVNVFANYNLSTAFKGNKTLAVQPFSLGFTLIPF